MPSRFALAGTALMLIAAPAASAQAPADAAVAATLPAPAELAHVALNTEMGTIVVALDRGRAPVTTANFLRYIDQKRFDGIVFYRVMRLDWGTQPNGLVQAGTQGDPKRVFPPIAHEPTNATGILHKAGAISMARYAPGTASGDFSILLSDMPGLDADPDTGDAEAAAGFAAFGHVAAGMDVVRRIFDVPLSPTAGSGVLKGQMIEKPVKILSARRSPPPATAPVEIRPQDGEGD